MQIYIKILLIIILILLNYNSSPAQVYKDYALPVNIDFNDNNNNYTVNFSWQADTSSLRFYIYKKNSGEANFSQINILDSTVLTFSESFDTGKIIEYGIEDYRKKHSSYYYTAIGKDIQPDHYQGRVLVLIDSTVYPELSFELERLSIDLVKDGFYPDLIPVPRSEEFDSKAVQYVKSIIQDKYIIDNDTLRTLLLIGRVPVPYSGAYTVDGHYPDHFGAWPSDIYYAELDGKWTDTLNTQLASDPRQHNIAGDGKFDQVIIPSSTELEIGRVDFYNLPAYKESEIELLRNYLNKNHLYRNAMVEIPNNAIIDNQFDEPDYIEAFPANGWINFYSLLGTKNITEGKLRQSLSQSPYLFVYGSGPGSFNSAYNIAYTDEYATNEQYGFFYMLFGSYFGDWDSRDNLLRAVIASSPNALISVWAGRPYWQFQHLAVGKTFGYSAKLTQNISANSYISQGIYGFRYVHVALMGDPTLRLHYTESAKYFQVKEINNIPELSWSSPESYAPIGYNIYRSNSLLGKYEKLNQLPILGNNFIDSLPALGNNYYMLRAVSLTETNSGSYYNLSPGVFTEFRFLPEIDLSENLSLLFAPNPVETDGNLIINSLKGQTINIEFFDITGRRVFSSITRELILISLQNIFLQEHISSLSATLKLLKH